MPDRFMSRVTVSLAAGAGATTAAHSIVVGGVATAPQIVLADRISSAQVDSVDGTNITVSNPGATATTVIFLCWYAHSVDATPANTTPGIFWLGGSSGGVVGGITLLPDGTVGAPGLAWVSDTNTGLYRLAADTMSVALGGVAALNIAGAEATTYAAAANMVGQDVYFDAADAGPTALAARVGGTITFTAGKGSAGYTAVAAGTGGSIGCFAGAGGATSAATNAGVGGVAQVQSGAGGASTGGATGDNGGNGGASNIVTGNGGATNSTGAHAGGTGGLLSATAGNGGAATAGTSNGGAGGDVGITAGTGGNSTGGNGGAGGTIRITAGTAGTGGTPGANGVIIERSIKLVNQGAPHAATTDALLTAAQVLTGIITVDGAGSATTAQQLPTAANMDLALPDAAAGDAFDFSVINISTDAAEICTITTNTGWTLVGNVTLAANSATTTNSFGSFRARKTGAAAWTLYRMG